MPTPSGRPAHASHGTPSHRRCNRKLAHHSSTPKTTLASHSPRDYSRTTKLPSLSCTTSVTELQRRESSNGAAERGTEQRSAGFVPRRALKISAKKQNQNEPQNHCRYAHFFPCSSVGRTLDPPFNEEEGVQREGNHLHRPGSASRWRNHQRTARAWEPHCSTRAT